MSGVAPRPRSELLLVVEDDSALAQLVQAILEDEGHSSHWVRNGREAMEYLAECAPKLVLLDYTLPDMTGLELVDAVEEMPPFLVTTGSGDERVAVELMKRGAREYLIKDANFVEFLPAVVRRILHDLETEDRLAKAEAQLRESQEQLRLVLERTNNIFWEWDLENGRYTISDQGYRLLDYEQGEITPDVETWKAHLHPDDLGPMMKLLQGHIEGASPAFESEFRLRKKFGGWAWVLSRGQVVSRSPEGRALRISGIMTEISQMKRAEEAIRQAEKSGSLSLMAAGIAHDFNNQFQALLGNLELAQHGVEATSREGRALARAVEVLKNAAQLSQKILDFTGRSFRQIQRIHPAELLSEQEPELRKVAQAFPAAQLRMEIPAQLPAIEADAGQVVQILRNLLQNGFEALHGHSGIVTLEAELRILESQDLELTGWVERPGAGPHLCLRVVDSGGGMEKETLSRAGDPFFSTKASGRGLGLAATRGILRSHGGGLWIASEPGKGTTICACFPVAEGAPAFLPAPSSQHQEGDFQRKTLLLVDDEDPLREVMAEAIRDVMGFPLLEARDGLEGLEVLKAHADEIALVLMDAKMPRMNGIDAFQLMKEIRPDLKSILCSGYSEEFGLSTAQSFGFLGFLKKPFSLSALKEAIEKALEG